MDKKQYLSADLIAALEKAVVDGKYDGTREENKLLRYESASEKLS